jgi:L-ascorbate metabolism protein UlaG (beta-lactamase superfamily)
MANEDLRLTLIGGPTLLIEWSGLRLLTDPTFDPPGSVYEYGPVVLRKTVGPALEAASLGTIHGVLLSHDQHADNLGRSRARAPFHRPSGCHHTGWRGAPRGQLHWFGTLGLD